MNTPYGAEALTATKQKLKEIEGDKVIVSSDNVPNPLYVRYAWADSPVNPNLYSKERLPASPFRTDDF